MSHLGFANAIATGIAALATAKLSKATFGIFGAGEGIVEAVEKVGFDPWNIGAAGFVVWYAWYVTASVMPKVAAKHEANHKESAAAFTEQVKQTVAEFRDECKEQRELHRQTVEAITRTVSGRQS